MQIHQSVDAGALERWTATEQNMRAKIHNEVESGAERLSTRMQIPNETSFTIVIMQTVLRGIACNSNEPAKLRAK